MSEKAEIDINHVLEKHPACLGAYVNLRYANLRYVDLAYANLWSADLRYANLWSADLRCVNLRGANLGYADLRYANLGYADLAYANLWGADLRGADLAYANLWGADLWGCNGNLIHIKSVFCDQYPVTYTADVIQIGCERHPITDWWGFNDKMILEMDGKTALKWWRTWKPTLKQIIETSPAEATGHQGE